jgi:antitoxin component HigA of HigAB toxin-antitoxin module
MMTVNVLRTAAEYRAAMAEIAALIEKDPDPDTPEGDRLRRRRVLTIWTSTSPRKARWHLREVGPYTSPASASAQASAWSQNRPWSS